MTETEIRLRLREVLVRYGIPDNAIQTEMRVNVGLSHHCRVDMLVETEDYELPVYLFEIKSNGGERFVEESCRELRVLSRRIRSFVVIVKSGRLSMARIGRKGRSDWFDIQNETNLCVLLGNYEDESLRVISLCVPESAEFHQLEMRKFRHWLVCSGTAMILVCFFAEMVAKKTVSYQLAGLMGFVMAMYAASYGIVRSIKFNGLEISLCHQDEKERGR